MRTRPMLHEAKNEAEVKTDETEAEATKFGLEAVLTSLKILGGIVTGKRTLTFAIRGGATHGFLSVFDRALNICSLTD